VTLNRTKKKENQFCGNAKFVGTRTLKAKISVKNVEVSEKNPVMTK
jgi:hypothetical protein